MPVDKPLHFNAATWLTIHVEHLPGEDPALIYANLAEVVIDAGEDGIHALPDILANEPVCFNKNTKPVPVHWFSRPEPETPFRVGLGLGQSLVSPGVHPHAGIGDRLAIRADNRPR